MMLSGMRKVLHVLAQTLISKSSYPLPPDPVALLQGLGGSAHLSAGPRFQGNGVTGTQSLLSAFLQGLLPFTPPQLPRRALERALRRGHASGTLPQSPLGLERMGRVTVPSCHP